MSVVVAVKQKDQVYIGCDSQVSSATSKYTLTNKNNYKIWKVKGCEGVCMMGGVGSLRDINIIRIQKQLIHELAILKDDVNFDYVVGNLVPRLMRILDEEHRIKTEDKIPTMSSRYLFAYKNLLFEIGSDGSVIEIDDYTAIGSGDEIALGSLNTTASLTPVERIIRAIEASAKTNLYVNYPIVVGSTGTEEITFVEDENTKNRVIKSLV